jgi:hypothetical protein
VAFGRTELLAVTQIV